MRARVKVDMEVETESDVEWGIRSAGKLKHARRYRSAYREAEDEAKMIRSFPILTGVCLLRIGIVIIRTKLLVLSKQYFQQCLISVNNTILHLHHGGPSARDHLAVLHQQCQGITPLKSEGGLPDIRTADIESHHAARWRTRR